MVETDIFINSSHKNLGFLRSDICGFGCPNNNNDININGDNNLYK